MITKQLYEAQLQQIFHMLLENKTNEQIASELKISVRTVQNYKQRLEQRYGNYQMQKTNDTLILEVQLYKNRMLTLYKALQDQVTSADDKTTGVEKAKCAEVAAYIATNILKLESEELRAIKQVLTANNNGIKEGQKVLENLHQSKKGESDNIREYDPNRKF
ncbi:MAG TPA: LuxR C-terminal-related transcriptional regulator [Nitrososphaeraceae archaeon]|nr:LuxR C-terminal-related transcriptional regulator [Nitrososphaeraceae archaeon]